MNPPEIYVEWLDCFDAFEARGNDEEVLAAMRAGTFDMTGQTAENFTDALASCIASRLDGVEERFASEIAHGAEGEGDAELALMNAISTYHAELRVIEQVIELPVLAGGAAFAFREALQTRTRRLDDMMADMLVKIGRQDLLVRLAANPFSASGEGKE